MLFRSGGRGFSGKGPGPEALTDPEGGFLQGFAEADEAWAAYWRKYKADKGGGNV